MKENTVFSIFYLFNNHTCLHSVGLSYLRNKQICALVLSGIFIRRDQANVGTRTDRRICYGREIPSADSVQPSWPAGRGCYARDLQLHT